MDLYNKNILLIFDVFLVVAVLLEIPCSNMLETDYLLLEYLFYDVYIIARAIAYFRNWLNPYVIFLYMINFFLGSRLLIDILGGEKFFRTSFFTQYDFSYDVRISIVLIMLLGMSSLNLGMLLGGGKCEIKKYIRHDVLLKCSKIMIMLLFLPLIYYFYKIAMVVSDYGYTSLLINGEKGSALRHVLYLFYFSYYLFLASKPNKSEFVKYTVLYMMAMIASLFTGERGMFAIQLLLIVWYYNEYIERIDIKKILLVGMAMLVLFEYIDETRQTQEYDDISVKSNFVFKILEKESNSLTVLGYAEEYKDYGSYTDVVYPVIAYFGEKIGVYGDYEKRNLDYAHKLSIWVNPEMYYSAHGVGSCYLAEIYSAFGYVGVCVCSFLLGAFIVRTYSCLKFSFLGVMFLLVFYKNLFWMPRGSLLIFIPECFRYILLAYMIKYLVDNIVVKEK